MRILRLTAGHNLRDMLKNEHMHEKLTIFNLIREIEDSKRNSYEPSCKNELSQCTKWMMTCKPTGKQDVIQPWSRWEDILPWKQNRPMGLHLWLMTIIFCLAGWFCIGWFCGRSALLVFHAHAGLHNHMWHMDTWWPASKWNVIELNVVWSLLFPLCKSKCFCTRHTYSNLENVLILEKYYDLLYVY